MKKSMRFSKDNAFKYMLTFLKAHSLFCKHLCLKTSHFQKRSLRL